MRKPQTAPASRKLTNRVGGFETVKIVREFTDIQTDPIFGESLGTLLDEHLRGCAERGEEVQSVTLHIVEEHWSRMALAMNGQPVDSLAEEYEA
jgi:hypothetical protein